VIVLGIDPGTATTGFGVVRGDARRPALVECGVLRTSSQAPLATRLAEIFGGVAELIARHRPDMLAVEEAFYSKNARTALVLGHARGVILLAGARAGVPIREFAPAMIKKTVVGVGSATKQQVQFMTTLLLRLKSAPSPADAADGVAAALTLILTAQAPSLSDAIRNESAARNPFVRVQP
jgi:crossover junction endodeoxyribonuclease RuvC